VLTIFTKQPKQEFDFSQRQALTSAGIKDAYYAVVTTTIRLRFDCYSIANRPRYDHSTTYVTIVG